MTLHCIVSEMEKTRKCKRYDGKRANVTSNLFFEEYMKEVAKGEYFIDKFVFLT